MKAWRIFKAGVRIGQASPVRLTRLEADELVANIGVTAKQVAKWEAQDKADWEAH